VLTRLKLNRLFRRTGVAGVARAGWGAPILKFERSARERPGRFQRKIARNHAAISRPDHSRIKRWNTTSSISTKPAGAR